MQELANERFEKVKLTYLDAQLLDSEDVRVIFLVALHPRSVINMQLCSIRNARNADSFLQEFALLDRFVIAMMFSLANTAVERYS